MNTLSKDVVNIVFFSGMFGKSERVFSTFTQNLRRKLIHRECRYHYLSLKGHDRPGGVQPYSLGTYFRDLRIRVKTIAETGDVLAIGHSLGGLIAKFVLEEVLNSIGVASIASAPIPKTPLPWQVQWTILRNPLYLRAMWKREVFKLERRDANWIMFNSLSQERADRVFKTMTPESGPLLWEIATRQFREGKNILNPQSLFCPLLEISGKEDKTCPPRFGKKITNFYKKRGIDAQHVVLPGGHFSVLENPQTADVVADQFFTD
ncbi:MAG TPA: alpha/beta hydrolase [Candidatus Paceibacterota bacterium]|nr:alpha/beta hydrolase [Candidatus Paceibacterota bacterium]